MLALGTGPALPTLSTSTDTRVTPVNVDAGTLWIVWNSTATKVWSFNKVDAVVGTRCYFAQPQCSVNATVWPISAGSGANQISSAFGVQDSALALQRAIDLYRRNPRSTWLRRFTVPKMQYS